MILQHYHNNAYDTIVLRRNGRIVGAWSTVEAVEDFYERDDSPADWDANGSEWQPQEGVDRLVATIESDGKLIVADEDLLETVITWLLKNNQETPIEKLVDAIDGAELVDGCILLPYAEWIADDGNQAIEYDPVHYTAREAAEDYVATGDWGDDCRGVVSVSVWQWGIDRYGDRCRVNESTHYIDLSRHFDHEQAIRAVMGDAGCGDSPDAHDWTSEGEGGCDTNPGVWSTGGTTMVYKSHCRCCGLTRTETILGSQRNPGEGDSVEYDVLDEETIAEYRKHGWMDSE